MNAKTNAVTVSLQRAAIECAAHGLNIRDFIRVAMPATRYPLAYVLAWVDSAKV